MIHLDLQPELEAQLTEAAAHGLSLDRYVESIVADHSCDAGRERFYSCDQKLTEQQLAANLRQGFADIAEGRHPPRREGVYGVASPVWHPRLGLPTALSATSPTSTATRMRKARLLRPDGSLACAMRSSVSRNFRFEPALRLRPSLRRLLYGNKPHVYRIIYSINEEATS